MNFPVAILSLSIRESLIKVYFRQYGVRYVLRKLLTYNMLTIFLRAHLPCPDKNIHLIRLPWIKKNAGPEGTGKWGNMLDCICLYTYQVYNHKSEKNKQKQQVMLAHSEKLQIVHD